jgi:hypothetical protein
MPVAATTHMREQPWLVHLSELELAILPCFACAPLGFRFAQNGLKAATRIVLRYFGNSTFLQGTAALKRDLLPITFLPNALQAQIHVSLSCLLRANGTLLQAQAATCTVAHCNVARWFSARVASVRCAQCVCRICDVSTTNETAPSSTWPTAPKHGTNYDMISGNLTERDV